MTEFPAVHSLRDGAARAIRASIEVKIPLFRRFIVRRGTGARIARLSTGSNEEIP